MVPPCVVEYGVSSLLNLAIVGTGFTPGGGVAIDSTTASNPTPGGVTSAIADATGAFTTKTVPEGFDRFDTTDQTYNVIATDRTNPAISATTPLRQVRFGFDAKPNRGRPSRKVVYTARGFAPGKPVYAHFRFAGQTRRTIKIGVADVPCGTAALRMRLLPTKTRYGTWTIYMDQAKLYNPRTARTGLSAKGSLDISKTFA
jgi:hypothetical protein